MVPNLTRFDICCSHAKRWVHADPSSRRPRVYADCKVTLGSVQRPIYHTAELANTLFDVPINIVLQHTSHIGHERSNGSGTAVDRALTIGCCTIKSPPHTTMASYRISLYCRLYSDSPYTSLSCRLRPVYFESGRTLSPFFRCTSFF